MHQEAKRQPADTKARGKRPPQQWDSASGHHVITEDWLPRLVGMVFGTTNGKRQERVIRTPPQGGLVTSATMATMVKDALGADAHTKGRPFRRTAMPMSSTDSQRRPERPVQCNAMANDDANGLIQSIGLLDPQQIDPNQG